MAQHKFRITCCVCGKLVPQRQDVHALDAEWQRRRPEMVGALACEKCVTRVQWRCYNPDDRTYVDGHLPSTSKTRCYDSWDHLLEFGTQTGMVLQYPEAGVLQGAMDYLRQFVGRPGVDHELARQVQAALDGVLKR